MVERPISLQDLIRRRQAGGFVGRQEELGLFQENLRLAVDDSRRRFLFSIRGDAGVGKTFLLRQFMRLARERGYATAYVDESVFDIPTVMDTLAADLARQDKPCKDFTKRSETYRKHRHELDADPTAPDGLSSALTRSAVRIGLRTAEDIPLVGPFAKELNTDAVAGQVDRLRSFLSHKLRSQHEVRLMLAPVDELTPTFVDDLRAIASHQPVALFFDTYERTGTFLDPWLLDLLAGRYGDLPPQLVLTIAGQHPLDINTWGDYLGIRADLALQVFTDTEARELLATRGVTDNSVVEVILGLTGRLPVLVAMLAEAQPDTIEKVSEPSDNAVERFLKWEKDEQRRVAALHGALPRRLDKDAYAVATGSTSVDEDFAWLRGLPFVTEHTDGYRYHDIVRDTMLRVQRRRSPAEWQQRHTTLSEHYHAARDALGLAGRAAWRDNQWQDLAVEEHYHRLCANPATALPTALAALIDVLDNQPDSAARWTTMIRQAGQDINTPALTDRGEQLCTWSADQDNGRILLLTHLITEPTLDEQHRAIAYGERGNLHLKHNQHVDALTDLTRAIELDPTYELAITSRGFTYVLMGRYDDALTDLTRAIELDPTYKWAITSRGFTYHLIGRYDDALTDLTRAIELDPTYVWAITSRGHTYQLIGRYDDALTDLTRAIELDPTYVWAITGRGHTYRLMERYEDALADLTRAIELDPTYELAITSRGWTYRLMGRYDDALTDLNRAIELNLDHGFRHYQIGLVALAQGRADAAHDHMSKAIEVDRRGIEKFPRDGWRALHIAVYLLAMGETRQAERQIRETLEQTINARAVQDAIDDLKELQAVCQCDVADVVDLLRSHLSGD